MSDPSPIRSPCVRTCRLEGEVCVGCGRTRAEIALWTRMSAPERDAVMSRLAQRAPT
jgi:uncharacterized protein